MKYPVFAIHDVVAEQFMSPQVDQNDSTAWRNFEHAVETAQSVMHSHPGDFDFYKIGTYETDSGMFIAEVPPVFLGNGKEGRVK